MEDYLEAIAMIKKERSVVRVKDIGNFLHVKPSSVHSAISNLQKRGYVIHERYGYVDLTPEGETKASDVVKRHEILRDFLTEVIGIDRLVADKDACIMEHALSKVTVRKLMKFVEFVQKCPEQEKPEWLRRFDHYYKTGRMRGCREIIKRSKRQG
jgi:DtxR family Mn-dependent transcriptional regulator